MYMVTYWNALKTPTLSTEEVTAKYPNAIESLSINTDLLGQFREDLFPAFGPGGSYSEKDDDFYGDTEDDVFPTITGDTGLFFYNVEADELWNYHVNENEWFMWNY